MQDPNEDTEWNDVLRAKGILPPKEKKVNREDKQKKEQRTEQNKFKGRNDGSTGKEGAVFNITIAIFKDIMQFTVTW